MTARKTQKGLNSPSTDQTQGESEGLTCDLQGSKVTVESNTDQLCSWAVPKEGRLFVAANRGGNRLINIWINKDKGLKPKLVLLIVLL